MELFELQTLAKTYSKAYWEDGVLGIYHPYKGGIKVQMTRTGLEKLFGNKTDIEEFDQDTYFRTRKVGEIQFYCLINRNELTHADRMDLEW